MCEYLGIHGKLQIQCWNQDSSSQASSMVPIYTMFSIQRTGKNLPNWNSALGSLRLRTAVKWATLGSQLRNLSYFKTGNISSNINVNFSFVRTIYLQNLQDPPRLVEAARQFPANQAQPSAHHMTTLPYRRYRIAAFCPRP
jgi:hypothetical protein